METSKVLSATLSYQSPPSEVWKALGEALADLQPGKSHSHALPGNLLDGRKGDIDLFRENPPEFIIQTEGEITTLIVSIPAVHNHQGLDLDQAFSLLVERISTIMEEKKK